MVRHLFTIPGITTCWLREPAKLEPDGNRKAYWVVAHWVSRSMRSMKAPSSSAAAGHRVIGWFVEGEDVELGWAGLYWTSCWALFPRMVVISAPSWSGITHG